MRGVTGLWAKQHNKTGTCPGPAPQQQQSQNANQNNNKNNNKNMPTQQVRVERYIKSGALREASLQRGNPSSRSETYGLHQASVNSVVVGFDLTILLIFAKNHDFRGQRKGSRDKLPLPFLVMKENVTQ